MTQGIRRTRRDILKRGLLVGGAAVVSPYMLTSRALGSADKVAAGDRLALGFIGVGGKGLGHLRQFVDRPEVQVVAVADVYGPHRDRAVAAAGPGCASTRDYRELLANENVDAVVISTPDHWHALQAIHACEAGKDVYCEKPLTLTIEEGRRISAVARQYGTVFQVGSQQRSHGLFRRACELVRNGRIGRLEWIKARVGEGPTCAWEASQPPPKDLDWDAWLGPAPWAEYSPKRCLHKFRWFYDYSGGRLTDWGAHHNDIAQWANDSCRSGPVRIDPIAVTFPTAGLFETAIRFEVKYSYANGVVLYTVSEGNDVEFHGTDGWLKVNRKRIEASHPDMVKEPLGRGEAGLRESPGHHRDWLDCIRSRRQPICDAEIGARSAAVCHLGNIALRTGRSLTWDPSTERITHDENLNRWLNKPYRSPWHL
ncbi:MAG: Gfo/Idh/MocA family oxidoreductase [Phycisphaerae bacterium]|nr:Gfo/Idh/MocA family oxidoreductase [Phycisphaerae bacterium]